MAKKKDKINPFTPGLRGAKSYDPASNTKVCNNDACEKGRQEVCKENFRVIKDNYFNSSCRSCDIKLSNKWNKNNHEKVIASKNKRKEKNKPEIELKNKIKEEEKENLKWLIERMGVKPCYNCGEFQKLSEYRLREKGTPDEYRTTWCHTCEKVNRKHWDQENPEKVKAKALKAKEYNESKKLKNPPKPRSIKPECIGSLDGRNLITTHLIKYLKENNIIIDDPYIYLNINKEEFLNHLKNNFEPWMTWKNYGTFIDNCKDDDQTTWKWALDYALILKTNNINEFKPLSYKTIYDINKFIRMKTCEICSNTLELNLNNFDHRNKNEKWLKYNNYCRVCQIDVDAEKEAERIKKEEIRKEKLILRELGEKVRSCIISRLFEYNVEKNSPTFKALGYSKSELKESFEIYFKLPGNEWMTWGNHGPYNPKTWDDNNSSTWCWNIDHIIPHSMFKYTSMDDEEFRRCWGLANLRPYSAKQNILDGVRRIRHY